MDFFTNLFKDGARAIVDWAKNHWQLLVAFGLAGVAGALIAVLSPKVEDIAKAGDAGGQQSANVGTTEPTNTSTPSPKDELPPPDADAPNDKDPPELPADKHTQQDFVLTGTVVRAPDGRHGIDRNGTIYLPYYAPMQRFLGQFTGRTISMTVHNAKPRENETRLGEIPVFVHSVDVSAMAIDPIELSEDVTVPGGVEVQIVWGDRGRAKIEYQGVQAWVDMDQLDIVAPVAHPSGYSVPPAQQSTPAQTSGFTGVLPVTK